MYKLVAGLTTVGLAYCGLAPRKIPLTLDQRAQLMSSFMPQLNSQYDEIIIGGSTGLKIYTGRSFTTHDTDYFLKSKEDFTTGKGNYNEATLKQDLETLSTIVLPDHSWSIKLSSMNNYSVVANIDTQEIEQFDSAIGGTVNTIEDDNKLQFVMIDNSKDLEQWYAKASDLPVFINYNNGQPYFYLRNHWAGLMSKYGYLFSIRHRERKEKYEEKGFTCV